MNKLVITSKEDIIYYGYFQDGKAVELYCEKRMSDSLLGNIYVARVEKVAEGIQGAFLDLLDAPKRIGVCVSTSLLLVPTKSVTAIIGLGEHIEKKNRKTCEICTLRGNCSFRCGGTV